MEAKVIEGGRDKIEQELVQYLFHPGELDANVLANFDEKLRPKGKGLIALASSGPFEQESPHQSNARPD